MAKYKYFTDEKNRMVIAVSSYAKKRVKGVAIAAPDDEFDYEKGRKLAKARCDAKIANKRLNRALDKYHDALELYAYALDYRNRMEQYANDSLKEKTEADQRVRDMLDELI